MRTFLHPGHGYVEKPDWNPGCWMCVECPDEEDLAFMGALGVPDAFLQDIADADERPRLEVEDDGWMLAILRIPLPHDGGIPYITAPVGIIANGDILISVCHHRTEIFQDFIAHTVRKRIAVHDPLELILRLTISASVWFLRCMKRIGNEVAEAENQLERSIHNEDILRLMRFQKTFVHFGTSIRGNQGMLERVRAILPRDAERNLDLADDAAIELRQADSIVLIHSNILSGSMEAFASVIANNTNTVMKRMTGLSLILMLPTLIASLFGMNVPVYLEEIPHAFALITLAGAAISAALFLLFRKIRWF